MIQKIHRFAAMLVVNAMLLNALMPAIFHLDVKDSGSKSLAAKAPALNGVPTMVAQPARPWQPADGAMPSPSSAGASDSILLDNGRLARKVTRSELAQWRKAANSALKGEMRLTARVRLAEFTLSGIEEPVHASLEFQRVMKAATKGSIAYGFAQRGLALSYLLGGRYPEAQVEFDRLLASDAPGLNRKALMLMERHARNCAGAHVRRNMAGITTPKHLDPLCGASTLAVALKYLGMPYQKAKLSKIVRHTGFGSNMADIQVAARKLGLTAYPISSRDRGLRALFAENGGIPIVAHVEHDHFIAVTGANAEGVTYFCSDCGPWPGGQKQLTWEQWQLMEADAFLALARPNTPYSKALSMLPREGAAAVPLMARVPASNRTQGTAEALRILSRLRSSGLMAFLLPTFITCGISAQSGQCVDCEQICPMGPGTPSAGTYEPVNLATGAENYKPHPSLSVYNPIGPSVVWSHAYNSLSDTVPNGYGMGWYHPYMYHIRLAVGGTVTPPGGGGGGGGGGGESAFGGGGFETDAGGGPPPGTYSTGYMVYPNSATASITLNSGSTPTALNPVVTGNFGPGKPFAIEWRYQTGVVGNNVIVVTTKSRTKLTFAQLAAGNPVDQCFYYLIKVTDRMGNWIDLTYTGPYTFTAKNIFTNSFTGYNLSQISDKNGSALLNLYYADSAGKMAFVSDRYGRSVYYTVQPYQNHNVTPPNPQVQDELTQVSQVVSTGTPNPPLQYQYGYTPYSNRGGNELVPGLNTISVVSPTGTGMSTATIYYNASGYVWKVVDANGNQQIFTELIGNETKVQIKTPAGALVQEYTVGFDAAGNWSYTKNASNQTVVSASYADPDAPFRPSSITDGNNRTWTFNWDSYSNLLSSGTPKGTTSTYNRTYTNFALGELNWVQEGTKTSTTFTYNQPSGLVNTVNTPIPGQVGTGNRQTTTFSYDTLGNVTSIVEPGNNAAATKTTSFNYTTDGAYSTSAKVGEPVAVTDPLGKVWHFRYDSRDNVIQSWDPLGNTTGASYNLADQATTVTNPATGQTGTGSSWTQYLYLYPGGALSQVNAYDESSVLTRQVSMAYGMEGELLSRTGSAETVSLTYDAAYHTKTLVDGNANATTYTYNTKGQLTKISYPGASGQTFDQIQFTSYDVVGNLLTRVDGRNITTSYLYSDADGLLSNVTYPAYPAQNVTLTYDVYDRPTTVADGTGTSTSGYDDLDLLLTSTRTYTGISGKTFNYAYYPDGSRQTMVNPAGTWTYLYDANSRPTSMASPAGTASYQYLDNGWLSKRTLPNGAYTDYAYNALGALTGLSNKNSGGSTLSSYGTFVYDGVFNLRNVTGSVTGQSTLSGTQTWTYDTKDRLLSEVGTRLGGYTQNFGYDNSGNPTTFKGTGQTFNSDNQRSAAGYVFDGSGNPTTYAGTALTFGPEDQVTSIGANWSASYRADGLRAKKAVSGTSTYFLYDGGVPVVEMNSSGTTTAINAFGPDGLLARQQGGSWIQYQFDQQGNVAQRLNSSQTVLSSSVYDAYGVESNAGGTPTDPFAYNAKWGYQFDRETGLYACMFRLYDPGQGRWINRDPISYAGGMNLYGYCASGPVGWADPSGHGTDSVTNPGSSGTLAELVDEGIMTMPKQPSGGIFSRMWDSFKNWGGNLLKKLWPFGASPAAEKAKDKGCEIIEGGKQLLYRVVEEPEIQSLLNSGGRATPSPHQAFDKPFWTSLADADRYSGIVGQINGGITTRIWGWANPLGVGGPGPEMDGMPTWLIPNGKLPLLEPGVPFRGRLGP